VLNITLLVFVTVPCVLVMLERVKGLAVHTVSGLTGKVSLKVSPLKPNLTPRNP